MEQTDDHTKRLFFALWPSDEERRALARWRDGLAGVRGRSVPAGNLHLTLAFAGNVDPAVAECLAARAERVRGVPFNLVLDRTGLFRRGLLWAGTQACPEPLAALANDLAAVLADCGIAPDPRPFHPHVTLFRNVRGRAPVPDPPAQVWRADRFCLVHSRPGAGYAVLKSYPLCGDGPGSLSEHSASVK
ncbi:2'-5' RNA ligase [Thioalkalivibrio denitrificans]|uniref:RNA 2',3'-cyclic phosphodiesterase n=1 Tax=Thioalkalivibrio denitrificans TaxID=108003 RepID=A0A1V3NTD0_9GAMM|nr:RNA 2',3'-cyclic phosphodiesterase [Thioalkalivibrio denitrificans]OOG28118.1 2'-5' RNA ligase [Thioalkalivibrio denitrificans]